MSSFGLSKCKLFFCAAGLIAAQLSGCGSDSGDTIPASSSSTSSDETKTPSIKPTIVPSTGTTKAPAPIYEAQNLAVDESVKVSENRDGFYAVKLKAGGLYSFDNGPLAKGYTVYPETWIDTPWTIYDADGTELPEAVSYDPTAGPFGWTPPYTGIYFIKVGSQGTVFTVRSKGTASSDPYTDDSGQIFTGIGGLPRWLISPMVYTLQSSAPAYLIPVNLYEKQTYRFEFNLSGGTSGNAVLLNSDGEVEVEISLGERSTTRQTVSVNTSDIYYLQYRPSRGTAGNKMSFGVRPLPDTDYDGDPDETDPYPNDATRNSSTSNSGSNSGSGSGSGSVANCKKPYTGDDSDPQFYSFDYIAQFDQCAYRATGESSWLTDGDGQCQVLSGLIKATNSRFRPQYCSGSKLIR